MAEQPSWLDTIPLGVHLAGIGGSGTTAPSQMRAASLRSSYSPLRGTLFAISPAHVELGSHDIAA